LLVQLGAAHLEFVRSARHTTQAIEAGGRVDWIFVRWWW
jgi:hypothetical protein